MKSKNTIRKNEKDFRIELDQLDLEPIKVKLIDKKEGPGWTLDKINRTEIEYKRFLFLSFKYREEPIVPSAQVDAFWHQHILDTEKYDKDCRKLFGYFLHHFPYFGIRGEEDARNLDNKFKDTLRLYEEEFKEPPINYLGTMGSYPECSRSCSPQACVPGGCNPTPELSDKLKTNIRPRLSTQQ